MGTINKGTRKRRNQGRDEEIAALYKEGIILEEIGERYGLTRQRVSQITAQAGLSGGDGGLTKKTVIARAKKCGVDSCDTLAVNKSGYCKLHYGRFSHHGTATPTPKKTEFSGYTECLVEGCKNPYRAAGLCNNHRVNFWITKDKGRVTDLNGFLKVQKAKRLMGLGRLRFEKIQEYMEQNKELFEEDMYIWNG